VLFVTTYAVLGFYAMYFARKLFLNPQLADADERVKRNYELIDRASHVAAEMAKKIPPTILYGREYIDEPTGDDDQEHRKLNYSLFSKEVNDFLVVCEEEIVKCTLPIDFIIKASFLHYYRIRFYKIDSPERLVQQEKAAEWTMRTIMIDPTDPLPQLRLAEIYSLQDRDDECVSILEGLERNDESPQYLQQWLGYYLLFADGREQDAIRHSKAFVQRFPDSPASIFNIARAYSQMYERELIQALSNSEPSSEHRRQALEYLERSIRMDESFKEWARDHSDNSFDALANDPDFLRITALSSDASGGGKQ